MYNPVLLQEEFEKIEHGKARISAIKEAVKKADENNDVTYSLNFRLELCYESNLYGDSMDMLVIFPQVLKIIDEHPDIPCTLEGGYINGLDAVLWQYKWVLGTCNSYYQIPLDDCLKFAEDFKNRCISYGYTLKSYYKHLHYLYESIDEEYSEKCFLEYMKLPRDGNSDCKACDRNIAIGYYLDKNNIEKANELAKDIDEYKLTCNGGHEAWLRMNAHYMHYYLNKKDFDNANVYIKRIKRKMSLTKEKEHNYAEDFFYYYIYMDIGKALKLYKENWKDWLNEKTPADKFDVGIYEVIFFKKLGKHVKGDTIKLQFDKSFPLYNSKGIYKIKELEDFYYNLTKDIALKFDKRNGTDSFMKELEESCSSLE
ncbi:MAG: hypothetical protein IJA34_11425 [Lachnospiraceae bacterium]|nr:hypothetical protein [Lachnospiraceae bacterium]